MFPTPYFLPAEHAQMLDIAASLMLYSLAPRVLAQGELREPPGITIITKVPLSDKEREALGLIPMDEL